MSKEYLGYGYVVVQVSECHGHGVKRQHHATLCLTLAFPAYSYPTSYWNVLALKIHRLIQGTCMHTDVR